VVSVALLVLYAGTVGYALVRPGCSLLPVNPPALDQAMPGTLAQACAALGEPLPLPRYLPDGYRRLGIRVSASHPMDPSGAFRISTVSTVDVSFGHDDRRLIWLTAMRTTFPGLRTTDRIGPHPADVSERQVPGGSIDRAYRFATGGLVITVHARLDARITAGVADRIIASIP